MWRVHGVVYKRQGVVRSLATDREMIAGCLVRGFRVGA
jgi:hypothetical protein